MVQFLEMPLSHFCVSDHILRWFIPRHSALFGCFWNSTSSFKIAATTPQKPLSYALHGLRCSGWGDTVRSMWRFLSLHRLRCDRLKNWHFIKMPEVKAVKAAKPVWVATIIFEPTPPSPPSPPFFQSVEKSVCVTGFFGVTVFWKLETERTTSCSSNCHFISYISYLSKPKRSCMPARSANLRFLLLGQGW